MPREFLLADENDIVVQLDTVRAADYPTYVQVNLIYGGKVFQLALNLTGERLMGVWQNGAHPDSRDPEVKNMEDWVRSHIEEITERVLKRLGVG